MLAEKNQIYDRVKIKPNATVKTHGNKEIVRMATNCKNRSRIKTHLNSKP